MPITASSAQIAAAPIIDGGPKAQSASYSLSSVATTHAAIDISSTNLIALSVVRFGTLASESLTLQVSFDGGTNFRDYKTYATASFNIANGLYDVLTIKGTHARFVLSNGQAGSGVNVRLFV